nr:EOG090X02IK [Eulimnadia texana]
MITRFGNIIGLGELSSSTNLWRAVIAEFISTLLLVFFGCASCVSEWRENYSPNIIQIALTFGIVIATMVQALGHISGGHINPAISVAMLLAGKMSVLRTLLYIVAQTVGAIAGAGILQGLIPSDMQSNIGLTNIHHRLTPAQGFGAEFFATFLLAIVVFGVTDDSRRDIQGSRPLAIGLAVTTAILAIGDFTGGGLNPARSFGPAVVKNFWNNHWVYWVGPMAGAVAAAFIYQGIFRSGTSDILGTKLCWGYEADCPKHLGYSDAHCPGDHKGWVKSKSQQYETFFNQADFGYVRNQIKSQFDVCRPTDKSDSLLGCSENLQFCRGRRIYMDFRDLVKRPEPFRYKMDVLKVGQIGGKCKINHQKLAAEATHLSPLQSWAPEMRNLVELNETVGRESSFCDVYISKPVFVMKIDATVNMYHHFCDFFNLYASLHVNGSHREMFSRDRHILVWETFPYQSNFGVTWSAFTQHPVWNLREFEGKRVCFDDAVFPLLPRMIFGLFYNTPIIWGCEKSGLFHAFSKFVLHRLSIPKRGPSLPLRVTLLSRKTAFRRVLNEDELMQALRASNTNYSVNKVVFTHNTDFRQQLSVIHETDILIGMHGAGLTHLMFLPDWAAVFELYNCEDEHCYKDLARLRGVYYTTWKNVSKLTQQDEGHHPSGGAHAKFTNYAFDETEFIDIVNEAAERVQKHPLFVQYVKTQQRDEL